MVSSCDIGSAVPRPFSVSPYTPRFLAAHGHESQSQFTAVRPLTREKCARLFDTSVAPNAKL